MTGWAGSTPQKPDETVPHGTGVHVYSHSSSQLVLQIMDGPNALASLVMPPEAAIGLAKAIMEATGGIQ